jgi:rhodanese-related sulfurtransferase
MSFLKDLFSAPQFASQEDILRVFQDPKTVVIDARSPPEITTRVDATKWVNIPATPFACEALEKDAEKLVGKDKGTPVIVYCASGKRSQKAAETLMEQGYTNVYNAGGIGSIGYLPMRSG